MGMLIISIALMLFPAGARRHIDVATRLAPCEAGEWVPHEDCSGICDQDGVCKVARTYAEVAKGTKVKELPCTKCAVPSASSDALPCDGDWVPIGSCEGECDASGMCWHKRSFAEVAKGVEKYKVSCKCEESTAKPITDGTDTSDDSSAESPFCDGVWAPISSCEGECDASGMCWYKRSFAEVAKGVEKYQVSCKCDESMAAPITDGTGTSPISDDSSPESPLCDGVWAPSSSCEGECDASGMCWYKRSFAEVAKGVEKYQVSCKCDESMTAPITDGTGTSPISDDSSPESPLCDGVWAPISSCEGECDASGMCWYKRSFAEVAEGVQKYQVSCNCEESTASPTTTTTRTTTTTSTTSTKASSTSSSSELPPSSTSSTTSSLASTTSTTTTVTTTSTSTSTASSASTITDDDGSPGSARANRACGFALLFSALLGGSQL
ncbi:unnamed protein product [Prorocentrum cordatum]|uniref:Spondin-like TSP1 domain-containing protein n=1 Tax=Prorocentrum cordatum TaxID=2364126 RepID=A0ABN9XN94_9DINO|nr:unnamed protein product [Polarella glacialis]